MKSMRKYLLFALAAILIIVVVCVFSVGPDGHLDIFYYQNNRLTISSFSSMIALDMLVLYGVIGVIAQLVIRKRKPEVNTDPVLKKKWSRSLAISAALIVVPVIMLW